MKVKINNRMFREILILFPLVMKIKDFLYIREIGDFNHL